MRFFRNYCEPKVKELVAKGLTASQLADVARRRLAVLESLPEMTPEAAKPAMRTMVEEMGLSAGQVFGILRTVVIRQKIRPPLFESMEIIDMFEVVKRLQQAISLSDNFFELTLLAAGGINGGASKLWGLV